MCLYNFGNKQYTAYLDISLQKIRGLCAIAQ